ncbi:TPA: helix-turn-helix domain-containing protein [Klebsiella quasipneumoniae subsp. similipneumoniae]|nr:helix-turn-helix domain-containing protein [Klebsiella quasipneumoniae subsp. similipneumoniae]
MLRQSDIAAAFRESILRSFKGFQYLHTLDFVTALRRRGIHLSEVEANSWIAREKTYFVDSALDHSENRLWIMAEMERELIVERTRAGLAAAREQGRVGGRRRVMTEDVVEQCRRMLENGATRQQVADVIGVDVKTIYKYLPAT